MNKEKEYSEEQIEKHVNYFYKAKITHAFAYGLEKSKENPDEKLLKRIEEKYNKSEEQWNLWKELKQK